LARIKSTLDLILEKTKHLSLSEQEKDALKQQELDQEARRHLLPFLREEKDIHSLTRWLGEAPPERRSEALDVCRNLLIQSLSPFDPNERVLMAVEKLLGGQARQEWESLLGRLKDGYADILKNALARAEDQFRELLASQGIRGPAVVPCPERTPAWKQEESKLIAQFQEAFRKGPGSTFPQR